MADFPIYCHVRYDTELNKNGKPKIVCKDVSDHDFVEVVRCGDCYAYRRDPELAKAADLDPDQYCALLRCEFPSDGFCSYGRRGDNG